MPPSVRSFHRFVLMALLPACFSSCILLVPFVESTPAASGCATCGNHSESTREPPPAGILTTAQKRRGHVRYFMKQLQDPTPAVRATAATTLGDYGEMARPAVPQLLRALNDESKFVRRAAVKALPRIDPNSAEVRAALSAARNDRDPWVAHSAKRVVAGQPVLSGKPLTPASAEILRAPKAKR